MKYHNYKGLIFDLDGTLLNTEPAHRQAWDHILAKYNLTFSWPEMIALNGTPNWRMAEIIIQRNQSDLDPLELAAEKITLAEQTLLEQSSLLPLIETVVKPYYGKVPMAVGTGSLHRIAEMLLRHYDLIDYFDVIVAADDVKQHKPEPETFLRCAELIGIAPEHCLVFEDADFGIQAAQRAGMAYVDVRELWTQL